MEVCKLIMKKNITQITATLFLVCSLAAGCSQPMLSDSTPTNDQQEASEQNIIINMDSSEPERPENTQASELSPALETSSSEQSPEQTPAETTPTPPETESSIEHAESIPSEKISDQTGMNSTQILNGYKMLDGMDTPVQVSFHLNNIQRGEPAYSVLSTNNPNLPEPEPGMEYIVITFNITYESGEADMLVFEESNSSLDSAKLFFYLSNGDSNAEQLTTLLPDNIYNLSLEKGSTGTGAVAFLHSADSNEPLKFVGFGNTLEFAINK